MPPETSQSFRSSKRKHASLAPHSKRQKFGSESRTLTVKPDPVQNRFEPIRDRKGRQKKRQREGKKLRRACLRKWTSSPNDVSNFKDRFVVLSYNILGVENASKHPDLYYKVQPKYLDWESRKLLIYEEVTNCSANILCFQEVDRFSELDDLLQKDGFKGVYKSRTGEACDGCAMFWKENLFTLLHQESIEFQSFGLRNNVAQLCVLKMNQSHPQHDLSLKNTAVESRKILVGNIHVLFNPNRGDIKLGQVRLFLEKAYELSREWGSIPVILAGDLNSIPQSAMYHFLASSELDIESHDRRNISGQLENPSQRRAFRCGNGSSFMMSVSRPMNYYWSIEEIELATGHRGVRHLHHRLKLSSAYLGIPGTCRTRDSSGEPLATSYHSKFLGTVDYIWHTKDLVPVRVLETLPIDDLRRTRGLLSKDWGSDHLALVCELAFLDATS